MPETAAQSQPVRQTLPLSATVRCLSCGQVLTDVTVRRDFEEGEAIETIALALRKHICPRGKKI